MSERTYKTRGIVLKKTKLREHDLIVTMLAPTGALMSCVAKGARKPGGSFAAKMELFSTVDVMLARGRKLDVVCEAKLANRRSIASFNIEQTACVEPIGELVCLIAQEGLEAPRLFDLVDTAFDVIAAHSDDVQTMLAVLAATLWKVVAMGGYRPSLDSCALCGTPIDYRANGRPCLFSIYDGGLICVDCRGNSDALYMNPHVIGWTDAFLRSRFVDIVEMDASGDVSLSLMHLLQQWVHVHTGQRLKSLEFVFTSGLF